MKVATAIIALTGLASVASADVIANWGFNDNALPGGGYGYMVGDFPMAADVGNGSMDLANWDSTDDGAGVYTTIRSFGGTSLSSIDATSGGSLAIVGDTNNGASAIFSVDGTNWANMSLTFDRRGTGTGFNSMVIEMFDGATSLGVVAAYGPGGSWAASTYSLAALDGVANASISFLFNGATSGNGNNRLDNVTISGDVIPAPGALALLGLGGLATARRRR